jgi:1A family penicillin-binding protein
MALRKKNLWGWLVSRHVVFAVIASGMLVAGVVVLWTATLRIPDLDTFDERVVRQSTKIYDRTGKILLFDVHENVRRTVVPLSDIAPTMRNATVAIEDAEFYEHRGVKPSAVIRATLTNLVSLEFEQGGSTITQQVVKNAILTQEKTIARKLKEWALSLKLEQVLSKEQILEIYLNEAPYGGNFYGVEEASQAFFAKPAQDLTLAESAYLAALPQAPTYYSPYGENREALEMRKNLVLKRMVENGFISDEEHGEAMRERVVFQPKPDQSIKAPHFVMFVREYLEKKYGERAIEERGLRVTTTLDYSLQEVAEEIVKRHALENANVFNAENAALVAVDPKTGYILTMVGSRDYFDEEIPGQFNVTTSHRQPGSAFKPFVYATAFKKGYTPETVVFDLQTQFSTVCAPNDFSNVYPCYSPENYDTVFRGPVTLRNALAQSINIPSVKTLYLAGLDDSLETAHNMGITSLTNRDQYGLTLVLGGGEVSPLEMASAYGVFANDGVRNPHTAILRVEDRDGRVLEEFETLSARALEEQATRQVSDILSDNTARAPAFGEQSYLHFPGREVAVKTGTTNNYRDAWIVGYTPSIAVAAWAGNNDNSPMEKKIAGFIVAPLWNEFMQKALATLPNERFLSPRSETTELKPILRGVWYDNASDNSTGDATGTHSGVHSILFWLDKNNPRGPQPTNPNHDPQFSRWEFPVRLWAAAHGFFD